MVKQYRQRLDTERGKQQQLQSLVKEKQNRHDELAALLVDIDEAKAVAQLVAKQTQEKLEFHISNIVELAMSTVFETPYEFEVEFETKYGKTVCNLWFVRNGNRIKPVDSAGVGHVDVCAFGVRVALLTLERPTRRRLMILDEPFKHLRGESYQRACSEMVAAVSRELGLQILMTSDVLFSVAASRVFDTGTYGDFCKRGKVSEVKEIE